MRTLVATPSERGVEHALVIALGAGDLADAGGRNRLALPGGQRPEQQPLIVFAQFAGEFGGFGSYRIKLIAGQTGWHELPER